MDVNYGAALKRYLTDCVTLIRARSLTVAARLTLSTSLPVAAPD